MSAIYIYISVKEIWTILTQLLHNKNKGINLHAGVFTNFNTSIRVEEIWVNGPVRKIISNRSRPILKILKTVIGLTVIYSSKCIEVYERTIPELS